MDGDETATAVDGGPGADAILVGSALSSTATAEAAGNSVTVTSLGSLAGGFDSATKAESIAVGVAGGADDDAITVADTGVVSLTSDARTSNTAVAVSIAGVGVSDSQATAAAGEEVITQGAAPDGMILLLSGTLSAEFVTPDGKALPVATIRPGTLVGEIGHYAGVPRTARVVAETPCRLLRLDARTLDALAAAAPQVAIDLHRLAAANLARRLMRTTSLLRDADV